MSTDSGTPVFKSRAEESRFLRMKLERAEREAAALRADRDALAAILKRISEINPDDDSDEGWNEWGEARCYSQIIDIAKQALSQHGGNNG